VFLSDSGSKSHMRFASHSLSTAVTHARRSVGPWSTRHVSSLSETSHVMGTQYCECDVSFVSPCSSDST
jgi:hypothetical protein